MKTIPYNTDEGIIELVRKDEHDAVVRELNERLTKQQSDMLDTIVQLRADLTRWQAMKKLIRQIYYDTETYADGALDATAHDKLCNEISTQLQPYIK